MSNASNTVDSNAVKNGYPSTWILQPLKESVAELASGDWGEEAPFAGAIECITLRGTDFSRAEVGDLSQAPVRFIKAASVSKRQLRAGDTLIELSGGSKDQPTGRILLITDRILAAADKPLLFSNFVKRIRLSRDMVDLGFFALHWLALYDRGLTQVYEKRTTGIRNFKLNDFLQNECIALPSLPEQRAIAHVLRTVQRAKEATEKVIAATRQLKQSLMRHLFTYGPVPFDQADWVKLRETVVGLMPELWHIGKVGDFAVLAQYGLSIRGEAAGRYPILRMNNLQGGKVVTEQVQGGLQYVDLDDATLVKFRLASGDLLFNRTNSFELVGKTSLFGLNGDFVFASYLVRLRLDGDRLAPRFANFYLNMPATQARMKFLASRGVSQSNINATKLKGFEVPIPPLPEQCEIAAQLAAVDAKLAAEETRRGALDALFQSLLPHLMTGKVGVHDLDLPAMKKTAP